MRFAGHLFRRRGSAVEKPSISWTPLTGEAKEDRRSRLRQGAVEGDCAGQTRAALEDSFFRRLVYCTV